MAKFPVYQTERSLPGQTSGVRANLDFDVGGRQLAAAAGGLGQAASDIGMTFYRLQGEAELVQAQAQNTRAVNQMLLELRENQDPESYAAQFEQTWSEIQAREVNNGWARRQYKNALPEYRVHLEGVLQKAKDDKALDNFMAAAATQYDAAVAAGNPDLFMPMLDSAHSKGLISGRMRQKIADELKYDVSAMNAWRDPAGTLKDLEDDKIEGRHFDADQLLRLRNIAESRQADQEKQQEEWLDSIYEDTLGKAATMQPEEFRKQLQQTVGMTNQQKTDVLDVYLKAYAKWQDGGVNPWTQTTNYESLVDTMLKIESGEIRTVGPINEKWLEGGVPNWGMNEMRWAKNLLKEYQEPTTGYSASHEVSKMYFAGLDSLYQDKDGKIRAEDRADYVAKRILLEEALKRNWGNAKMMDEAYAALTNETKKKKAKQLLSVTGWDALGGKWYPSQLTPPRGTISPPKRTIQIGDTITNPTTGEKRRWDGAQWQPMD